MRTVWFALIGPTIVEVTRLLSNVYREGEVHNFIGPSDNEVLFIDVYAFGSNQEVQAKEDSAELIAALHGATPTVQVVAEVSGRAPGDAEVKALAKLLLGEFVGFAFDDFVAYKHAWSLAEVLDGYKFDGMHFFDYNEMYARYKTPGP